MTDQVKEYSDFADLRQAAIGYAQDASGEIWTDFNLHDPGVTLLEQSCFALSEIAYRVAHPERDLLTDARGHFNFHDLAMFTPRKVLNTAPVTTADLEAWLSDCPDVARVLLTPAIGAGPGLYDLLVVPAIDDAPPQSLRERIARAFDAVRPLCCDRNEIRVAQCRKMRLVGQVEIMPDTLPEFAAAQLYHAVSIILRGLSPATGEEGATRKDAYDNPSVLFRAAGRHDGKPAALEDHLGDLRALPAIRDIGLLQLDQSGDSSYGDEPAYPVLHLPQHVDEIGLVMILDGVPVALDPTRLHEEYVRIAAERVALSHHHLDASDWQVMRPGRRRDFTHRQVDSLLPIIYRAALAAEAPGDAHLSGYRQAIDGHLASMTRDLAGLPEFFAAESGLPVHDPRAWRQKRALLDYLIALQGEEMPAARHTGLHLYHGARSRHRFELDWRLRYLYALPRLNAARATGPNATGPGGFLGRIALLADLTPVDATSEPSALARYGLRIGDGPEAPPEEFRADVPRDMPQDPLDMLGVEDDADPLSPEDLRQFDRLAPEGVISTRRFLQLARPDCLFLAPDQDSWTLQFEGQAPLELARFDDLAAARRALSSLRATWRALHRDSEEVTLVEDILLRGEGAFRPHRAFLVLTGWTARGMLPAFRSFVGQLIEQHAPAHLLISPLWLDHAQSARFAALRADAATKPDADAGLREFLCELEET